MYFLDTHYLYFLLLIPIFLTLFIYLSFSRKKLLSKVFHSSILKKLRPSSQYQKWIQIGLPLFCLLFLLFALSRPAIKDKTITEKVEGVEIILAVDISRSMLAQDVKPNRLSLIKTQLSQFLKTSKKNHRVALLVFAGSSVLLSPLTSDLNLIQVYLHSLSTNMITSQGTNFKSALEKAEKSFKEGAVTDATKVLMIASDGENHTAGALDVARRLINDQKVRIFSLGVGTKKGGVISLEGDYQRDQKGHVVQSKFKDQTLKEFAKIGKGIFYHVRANSLLAESLQNDLNKLDQTVFEEAQKAGSKDIFQYFLILSIILATLHWLMNKNFQVKR